jgi:hypothetical protein
MPYDVVPYSTPTLVSLLAAKTTHDSVNCKQHISYFHNYFADLSARTIVSESDYVDHDYLEDYASYYVKCFHDYERKCVRLHFFQESFLKDEFKAALVDHNSPLLQKICNSYLGFIVVKPLPKTIVGRTCLKTYESQDVRFYPITREYKTSLFGINLVVKTLAYQEQDRVAAACATSALWSVFHGTGMLFQHAIPSPIEITKAALEKSPAETRNLPNTGLTFEQRGYAVRDIGLDPLIVKAKNEYILKSTAYGYMRAGIPIYFSIQLYNGTTTIGGHGVALTGYRLNCNGPVPMNRTGFLLKASRIEKIYVHDDQVGPFARMQFDGKTVAITDPKAGPINLPSLGCSWFNGTGRAVPVAILIPLYHKIRIPYEVVHDMVMDFDAQIETQRQQFLPLLPNRIEWDIFLSQVNTLKSELLASDLVFKDDKEQSLVGRLPKYIWRAIGLVADLPKIELLFDATDIEQGNIFIKCIVYDGDIFNLLVLVSKRPAIIGKAVKSKPIFSWFAAQNPK